MTTSVSAHAEGQSRRQTQPKSLPSVRTLLFKLVFACLLPITLVIGVLLFFDYEIGRAQLEKNTIQSARAKVQTVDAQLAQAQLFAETLGTSGYLTKQDFSQFHAQSVDLFRKSNVDLSAVLYDANGQQLVNTNFPYGQPLPRREDLVRIKDIFASAEMAKQSLVLRKLDSRPVVSTMVPIFIRGKVAFALDVSFSSDKLKTVFRQLNLSTGSVAFIIDSSGTIAAQSLDADKMIGQKTQPEILKSKLLKLEGIVTTASRQGTPLIAAYSSSPSTGWGVVIGIPRETLEAPLRHNFVVFGLGAALVLFLSLCFAWLMGKRIAQSVRALHATAIALGEGSLATTPATFLRETDAVAQAMEASAHLLTSRTQELLTANRALEERTTELDEAQHISKTGSWKWDVSTGILTSSEGLVRLYGRRILLSFTEQRGTVFPVKAWQKIKAAARVTLKTKTGFSLLLPTLTAAKVQIWTRVNGEIVCDATGVVTGLRGTLQDVDVYIQAVKAMEESAEHYRTLFDGSPEAIVVHTNGVVAFANISAVRLFAAVSETDLVGASLSKFVHSDFQRIVAARLLSVTQLDESAPSLVLKLITLKGLVFSAQVKSAEMTFAGKRFIQTYIQDLTERKRHDAQIAHLQTELLDILTWQVAQHTVAALAHEVNQPLASASLLCEAANRMLTSDAKVDKTNQLSQTLQHIASEIERTGRVLRNLLKSVNQPDITRAPTMVNDIVVESIQTAFEEGVFGCEVSTDNAADLTVVKVNRLQVVKVLLNLIHNAAQAMQAAQIPNGKIHISTALMGNGSEICFSVRDQGPGISATLQQEVFQPFITTKAHGLGMGLTISRALIEANGGKLWHTQTDGLGATFHFTLPILS